MRCKECGQMLPPKDLPADVQFSPLKRKIWDAVINWPGMTAEDLWQWIYGADGPDDMHNISVNINQMNQKIRPHGIEINGHHGYRVREIT